jgi:hypothetical protein
MSSFEDWLNEEFKVQGFRIEEASLLSETGFDYWHSTILDKNTLPISGGFSSTRMQARKIAIAEFLERKTFREISSQSEDARKKWGFDIIPTACGFAAGFDKINTTLRALSEACERWVMSKWIDEGFLIEEIPANEIKLDPASQFFAKQFVEVKYYKKKITVFFQGKLIEIEVAQTMALTENGVFPGSSAQVNDGTIWQHSLLESYRHLLLVKNNTVGRDCFPGNKIIFFSANKDTALSQITRANKKEWPIPEIIFERVESKHHAECFVARIILKGWKSWHLGPIDRFLY